MRRAERSIVAGLVAVGVALAAGFVWIAVSQTGYCGKYPPPSNWIYAALVVVAIGLGFVVGPIALSTKPLTRARWAIVAASAIEGAAAIGLVVYMTTKFMHAYDCG